MGIEKKGVGKNPCIYLVQSVVNYNGCCIGSDIRCLPNIHESSIIILLHYAQLLERSRHVHVQCAVSRCLMITHKGGKGGRYAICLISYFQILNSVFRHVLWNFCDLFTFNAIVSIFMYCLFPLTCIVIPPLSFE